MITGKHALNAYKVRGFSVLARRSLGQQSIHRPMGNMNTNRLRASLRQASTLATPLTSLQNVFYGTALVLGSGLVYLCITDTRASIHRWFVVPALRMLYGDAEEAHHAANSALRLLWQFGLHPRERGDPDPSGDFQVEVFGHHLVNPIATSAGIDKDADIPDVLFALGPAVVEVGGATPLPQDGNNKPRVFRVPSQSALINRYGLNSQGADHMAMLLRHRVREFAQAKSIGNDAEAEKYVLDGHARVPPGSLIPGRLLAVNIAKNKNTPDEDIDRVKQDYVYCVERLGPYADILVVNVSSPNTPGLRSLQQSKPLTSVLSGVVDAAQNLGRARRPAVMVKVSPDEDSDDQIAGICDAVCDSGVDGVVVGNTTKRRPDSLPAGHKLLPAEEQALVEQGGYSGPQLFGRTISLVKKYRELLDSRSQPARWRQSGASAGPGKEVLDKPEPVSVPQNMDAFQASVSTGKTDLKNPSDLPDTEKQPLFQIPAEKRYHASAPTEPAPLMINQAPMERDELKVIFATGGITNGRQALDVLNAGASVAMVYTALVYGGVGTISRMKDEMRIEMKRESSTRRN